MQARLLRQLPFKLRDLPHIATKYAYDAVTPLSQPLLYAAIFNTKYREGQEAIKRGKRELIDAGKTKRYTKRNQDTVRFEGLPSKTADDHVYFAFDLLTLDGANLTNVPLVERHSYTKNSAP